MRSPRFKETKRREGTKLLKWERARRYFLAQGYTEVESTARFLKLSKPNEVFIFLGKAGAIRKGKSVTDSLDIAGTRWKLIEKWEQETGKGDCA